MIQLIYTFIYLFVEVSVFFCNLCSTSQYSNIDIDEYVKTIVYQLQSYSEVLSNKTISSIYFGGGTPTLLSEENFSDIFNTIHKYFKLSSNSIEQCIEGCPLTIVNLKSKLNRLASFGINRISMGVQSFKDDELKIFGRSHRTKDTILAIQAVKNSRIQNMNLDLIYGIENQSEDQWIFNLNKLMEFTPETTTLYPLNIRENTKLYSNDKKTKTSKEMYRLYDISVEYMKSHGYSQDTYVLFSKLNSVLFGYKQQQNEFHCHAMLGIGLAARSYLDSFQYSMFGELKCDLHVIHEYIRLARLNPFLANSGIFLNKKVQMRRYFILGLLDFNYGINYMIFKRKFSEDLDEIFRNEISFLKKNNIIVSENGKLILTKYGRKVSNMLPLLF